jgi:integrase
MEKVTTVGIDLAKRVFALHRVDGTGRTVVRRTVRREQLMEVIAGTVQELLGHASVETTMIYTHVMNKGGRGVTSPLDAAGTTPRSAP